MKEKLKWVILNIKIFIMALFGGYAFWRLRFKDNAISKTVGLWDGVILEYHNPGSYLFIDYHYARGLVK